MLGVKLGEKSPGEASATGWKLALPGLNFSRG
jgi:hypothetical protein